VDDMVVRQNVAIRRDDDAGAEDMLLLLIWLKIEIRSEKPSKLVELATWNLALLLHRDENLHDAWRDLLHDWSEAIFPRIAIDWFLVGLQVERGRNISAHGKPHPRRKTAARKRCDG